MSELEVRHALTVQESVSGRLKLGSILMIGGVVSEHRLLRVLMDLHGVPAVSWRSLSEAPEATVRLLPLADAVRWNAVPYAAHQKVLGVAFSKPSPAAVAAIASLTRLKVFPGVAPDVRILQAQQRCYGLSIEEPVARMLAAAGGSAATRLALEQLVLLAKETVPTREAGQEPPAQPQASSLPTPTIALRETADEAASSTKTLRNQVTEALAEFDGRSRAIFAGAGPRETPPGAVVEVVRTAVPVPEPTEPAPADPDTVVKRPRKTGFTTEDLRKLLTASDPLAPKRPTARRKTGITTADLRELMR